MPESEIFRVEHLDAYYGDVQVLRDVSLTVAPGEIVAIVGPNGAGKSSLMHSIMGMVKHGSQDGKPTVFYEESPLDGLPPEAIVRRGVALVPEGARVFPDMTCRDNLLMGGYCLRDKVREKQLLAQVCELFPRLSERSGQTAKTMSGGERQMLSIGRALMSEPRFLLLDEPSLGLHPLMAETIFAVIEKINREGLTVILVEQKVSHALRMCHRGYVLENGRVVLTGSGEKLMTDEHVRKAYLAM